MKLKLNTDDDVTEWVWGANAIAVVGGWNTSGLFAKLRSGPLRASELPADPRALAATIPLLVHLGLVDTDGELLALTPKAGRLMDEGVLPSSTTMEKLRDLSRMNDLLREGGPVRDEQGRRKVTQGGTRPEDRARTQSFLDMLYRIAGPTVQSCFDWLNRELPTGSAVLDLGGGHGRFGRIFADAGHKVTLFDQPMVIDLAKERHGDSLRFLEGDFDTAEDFGGPYDLILLFNIVHGESAATNASIIARAARNLRPGGRIAVRDAFFDEHGQVGLQALFCALIMLLYTEGGYSPTTREVEDWFAKAQLVDTRCFSSATFQIMTARRP